MLYLKLSGWKDTPVLQFDQLSSVERKAVIQPLNPSLELDVLKRLLIMTIEHFYELRIETQKQP